MIVRVYRLGKMIVREHVTSSIVGLRVQFGVNGIWLFTAPTYDFRNILK